MTRPVRLAFLGTPRIECDGVPAQLDTRKAVALLAYLAVNGGPAGRETLVTLLWSRYGRAGGHAALRRTLSTIRSALGKDVLATERENVGLSAAEDLSVDVFHFRKLASRCAAHAHGERGVCRECLPLLEEAATLVRGEFLAGFTLKDSLDFDDWQFSATEKLRIETAHLLDHLVLGKAALGDYGPAIGYALQRLELDKLDEAVHARLMRLHAWDGNPAAARQQFQELKDLLAKELDGEPGEATVRLAADIAHGRLPTPPALAPAEGVAVAVFAPTVFASVLVMRIEAPEPRASDVVLKYHGRIAESSETGFLAVFDDGRYVESNPELAVRAGLELRSAARRGAVATGTPGGRAVPLARLLAERAATGSLLADELTYHLTREAFLFDPARSGRRNAFLARGVAPVSRKTRGSASMLTEMVGREDETGKLSRAFEKAAAGNGQVVVITGEAGIGKSRLVRELAAAAGFRRDIRWLEGRCLAANTNVGYWPFLDMIDVLQAGLSGRMDPGSAAAGKGIDEILAGAPDPGALVSIARELLEGSRDRTHKSEMAQWNPEQIKHRAFKAAHALFRSLAAESPLVLVFEDLHWADTLSLELIDSLLDSLAGVAALVVLVHRPDPGHRSRTIAANAARRRLGDFTEIHLREITRDESIRMLEGLVPAGTLSDAARNDILAKARGNPYFLEELARAASATPESPLPDGIRAVVLSRFNSLGEEGRHLLSYGAVIGRIFPQRLLELAMGGKELRPVLDDLEDRELIFMERSVPELDYSFKHVLMQEAVYESLSTSLRKELHRKVAEAYQQFSPTSRQDSCESLAYHYDRAEDVGKAIDFYFLSGDKARRGYANAAAVTFFLRGLELLRSLPAGPASQDRELEFLLALGVPLVLARGHQDPTVEEVHLRALALCRERGAAEQLFQVNLGLNRYYSFDRKRLSYGEEMLDIATGMNDPFLVSRAQMMLSESYFYLGEFEKMASHAEKGYLACRPEHSPRDLVQFGNDTATGCLLNRALARWCLGFPDQARTIMGQAIQRAQAVGHAFTLAYASFLSGLLAFMLREPEEARSSAEKISSIARREGFAFYVANGLVLEGWAGNSAHVIRKGIELSPVRPFPCLYACMEAEAHVAAGDAGRAALALEEVLTVIRSTHLHLWEPEVCRMRGEIGRALGEPEVDFRRWLDRALKLSQKQKATSLELRATMALYKCHAGPERRELRERLSLLCRGFDEGQNTRDLRDAHALLES